MRANRRTSYLDDRPVSYWNQPEALLANVKGTLRRRFIHDQVMTGVFTDVPNEFLADHAERVRARMGAIHPMWMGGEYLPDCRPGEVEIARVCLLSTTGDAISIRARPSGARIKYDVVDEYEGDIGYMTPRKSSMRPLTMGQLIEFIDGTCTCDCDGSIVIQGLFDGYMFAHNDMTPLERVGFVQVESEFYAALHDWYACRAALWAERDQRETDAENMEADDPEVAL